jgi:phosphomevalonate kinase
MKLIGLSGKLGSGKNYIAEKIIAPYFKDTYNILILGFGDQVKNELYARDVSLTYDLLYDQKTYDSRNKLQNYATENGRDKYNQEMWIRGLDMQIETFRKRSPKEVMIIICDVRFVNEAEYIKKKNGLLFKINSLNRTQNRYWKEANGDQTKYNNISNHKSETDLDNYEYQLYNLVIDNDIELDISKIINVITHSDDEKS